MPDDTSSLIDLARRTHALTAEDLLRRRTPIMLTDPPTDGVIRMLNEELAEVRAEPG